MSVSIARQVAVTVHGAEGGGFPVAIQVVGVHADRDVLRALGSVDASWPEHYAWALRALDRGDVWVTGVGFPGAGDVWFFEGDEGAQLAGL